MPRIGMVEMMLIDDIFEKKNDRGYVLDFSNTTFARFFASRAGEHGTPFVRVRELFPE